MRSSPRPRGALNGSDQVPLETPDYVPVTTQETPSSLWALDCLTLARDK
jgi:hypothetical protein